MKKTERLTVRLTEKQREQYREFAKRHFDGCVSEMLKAAVLKLMEKRNGKKKKEL